MLMLDKIITAEELISKIDEVNLDNFYALSEQIFNTEKMSLSLVGKGMEGIERGVAALSFKTQP
jgi:hypothetical protein